MATTTTEMKAGEIVTSEVADANQAVQTSEVQETKAGWQNVKDVGGVEISIFGMAIVFVGLCLTFCYISLLPLIVGERKPKVKAPKPKAAEKTVDAPASDGLTPELQAAIAYVIAAEHEYEQLTDYTKITIRRDENHQAWGVAGKMRTLATRKIK